MDALIVFRVCVWRGVERRRREEEWVDMGRHELTPPRFSSTDPRGVPQWVWRVLKEIPLRVLL